MAHRNAELAGEKQAALTAETEAKIAARKAQREAENSLAEAQLQRERAETSFKMVRSAVDTFLNQVTENELLTAPGLQPLRRELLPEAFQFYTEFTQQRSDDAELRVELATAKYRLGLIHRDLGDREASREVGDSILKAGQHQSDHGPDSRGGSEVTIEDTVPCDSWTNSPAPPLLMCR